LFWKKGPGTKADARAHVPAHTHLLVRVAARVDRWPFGLTLRYLSGNKASQLSQLLPFASTRSRSPRPNTNIAP
jgi:hypothetical protein